MASVGIELPSSAAGAIEYRFGRLVVGQIEPPPLVRFEPGTAALLAETRLLPGRRDLVHDRYFGISDREHSWTDD